MYEWTDSNTALAGGGEDKASAIKANIVLIDDCLEFRHIMEAWAQVVSVNLKSFASLADMYSFAHLKNYDLAIIDFHLKSFCGIEIAEYVDVFFADLPVVLISGDSLVRKENWPTCIKGFIEKKDGPRAILQKSLQILEKVRYYRCLRQKAFAKIKSYSKNDVPSIA